MKLWLHVLLALIAVPSIAQPLATLVSSSRPVSSESRREVTVGSWRESHLDEWIYTTPDRDMFDCYLVTLANGGNNSRSGTTTRSKS